MAGSTRATLVVCCLATLLVLTSFTLPLNLLGAIIPELGGRGSDSTWILSASSLGLAALLLPGGSLADDFGRKRVFLVGGAVFAASAALGAVAWSPEVFIAARAGQGLGSAALLVASLALITHAFPQPQQRAQATGTWGAMLGAGIAIGPLGGALLGEAGSWRLAYWALTAAVVLTTWAGAALLSESRAASARRVDWPGMLLLSGGLVTLIAALVRGNPDGWGSVGVLGLFAASVVLLAGFVTVEQRRAEPMIDLALLRVPTFTISLLGTLVLGLTVLSYMSYFPTLLHSTSTLSPVGIALLLLPWSGLSFGVSFLAGPIARVITPRVQLAAGMVLCATGTLLLVGHPGWGAMVPGMVVTGVGTGLLNAVLARTSTSVVLPARAGMAGGANNTARYVGLAIGVAVVAGMVHTGEGGAGAARMDLTLVGCAALMLLTAAGALKLVRQKDFDPPAAVPAAV